MTFMVHAAFVMTTLCSCFVVVCLKVGVLCWPDDTSDQLHDTQTYISLQDNPKFALSLHSESKVDLPDTAPNRTTRSRMAFERT